MSYIVTNSEYEFIKDGINYAIDFFEKKQNKNPR